MAQLSRDSLIPLCQRRGGSARPASPEWPRQAISSLSLIRALNESVLAKPKEPRGRQLPRGGRTSQPLCQWARDEAADFPACVFLRFVCKPRAANDLLFPRIGARGIWQHGPLPGPHSSLPARQALGQNILMGAGLCPPAACLCLLGPFCKSLSLCSLGPVFWFCLSDSRWVL